MKNNRLIVDDMEYVIDSTYIDGAKSFRERVPFSYNPHSRLSDKNYSWDYGHTNDAEGFHLVDGIDVINAPRNGTTYRITTG